MNPHTRPDQPFPASRLSMDQIEKIAADWIAGQNGRGLSAGEQADLKNWLGEDPRNAQAFHAMQSAWGMLNAPRRAGHANAVWAEMAAGARRSEEHTSELQSRLHLVCR